MAIDIANQGEGEAPPIASAEMPAAQRWTLGCGCEAPAPQQPGSALCATCGLIFLTADEYREHLARSRAAIDEITARRTSRDLIGDSVDAKDEPEAHAPLEERAAADAESATDADLPAARPRRWWRPRSR